MIEFNLDKISDPYVREIMQRIREEFKNQAILRAEWRHIELTFVDNVTNFLYPHNLGFMPKDLFETARTGTGAISYNMEDFDATNINVTTTGTSIADPLVVRFFVGRYEEGSLV